MPYIGNTIRAADDYRLIDDISSGFNGSATSFALQVAGSAPVPFPKSPQQVLISVNGVIQEPDPTGASGFNLVGTNIVFSSAPTNGHAFFGIIYATADYLNAGGNFPAGSLGAPSITFIGDENTGLFRKSGGSVGFVSDATEIANFDSNGITISSGNLVINDSVIHSGDTNTKIRFPATDTVTVETAGSEALRINNNGVILHGHTSPITIGSTVFETQIIGDDFDNASILFARFANDTNGPAVNFLKSRGSSKGSNTIVQGGDELGKLRFGAADGSDFASLGGEILCLVDGTPGANDLPSRFVFETTRDTQSSPTRSMTIDQYGRLFVGDHQSTTLASGGVFAELIIGGATEGAGVHMRDDNSNVHGGMFTSDVTGAMMVRTITNHPMIFRTNNSDKARLTTAGEWLIGGTVSRSIGGSTQRLLQVESLDATAGLALTRNSANVNSPYLNFGKSRGTALNTNTVVVNGDQLGTINFSGADGNDIATNAANIIVEVDGTPGSDDMPGRILFGTTADGASSCTERLRIDSSGNVTIKTNDVAFRGSGTLRINSGSTSGVLNLDGGSSNHGGEINLFGGSNGGRILFRTGQGSGQQGEKMRLDENGSLAIGVDNPQSFYSAGNDLVVGGTSHHGITIKTGGTHQGILAFADGTTGAGQQYPGYLLYNHNTSDMLFATVALERMRINSDGRLLVSTTSARNAGGGNSFLQVERTDSSGRIQIIQNRAEAAGAPVLVLGKSRGTSNGASTIVQNGDKLGYIHFAGADGTDLNSVGASIQVTVDGTPGTNDMPCMLGFYTTPDGSEDTKERIQINASGDIAFRSHHSSGTEPKMVVSFDDPGGSSNEEDMYRINFWEGTKGNSNAARAANANASIRYNGSTSDGGDGSIRFANENGTRLFFVNRLGNGGISGSFSKGSGSFQIDHPLESKKDTHYLRHSFVEGPQADNIYRGVVTLSSGTATINLDTVSGMTEGTFVLVNTNVSCFTSNESDWTAVKGSVSGNILTITAQDNASTATVSWMVVGERHDAHVKDSNTDMFDDDGKLIVEPLKTVSSSNGE